MAKNYKFFLRFFQNRLEPFERFGVPRPFPSNKGWSTNYDSFLRSKFTFKKKHIDAIIQRSQEINKIGFYPIEKQIIQNTGFSLQGH